MTYSQMVKLRFYNCSLVFHKSQICEPQGYDPEFPAENGKVNVHVSHINKLGRQKGWHYSLQYC